MTRGADRDRLARIMGALGARDSGDRAAAPLCATCMEILRVGHVAVTVMVDGLPTPLCASDATAAGLEERQHALGEGPSLDAHRLDRPVGEPDLAAPRAVRWIGFGPDALAAGVGGVFSFPVRLGAVRLGALTLYQPASGLLSDAQHADALLLAGVIASAVLDMQARAPEGTVSPRLEMLVTHRAELHQAAGMVSVQLKVGIAEALARLRAHAYAAERPLADVVADIVARRLRLET